MSLHLSASVVSDVGPRRSGNEDAAFVASFAAAVADGVGGGPAGEIASAVLIHRVANSARGVRSPEAARTLLRLSNWDLDARVRLDPSIAGMATTFTGIFVAEGGLFLAHVGDSRAYLLRDGSLTRQTRDDSWVQHLVDSGLLTPDAASTHPRRNIVTASLHGDPRDGDDVTVSRHEARPGDRWLLCTDGVSDYLPTDALLETLLAHPEPEDASDALVALAVTAGTHDNVTAVVCDVMPGAIPSDARPAFAGAAAEHFAEDAAIA